MVTAKDKWLLTKVNGYWQRWMVTDKGKWLLTKVNGCQQNVNGYWYRATYERQNGCQQNAYWQKVNGY